MPHRIEITTKANDTHSAVMRQKLSALGYKIKAAKVADVYTINKDLNNEAVKKSAEMLANPVTQDFLIHKTEAEDISNVYPNTNNTSFKRSFSRSVRLQDDSFDYALEIGFLPGITDNAARTAKESIEDLLKIKFTADESVHTSSLIFLQGKLTKNKVREIGKVLANELIQRVEIKDQARFKKDKGMGVIIPKVKLQSHPRADKVDLNISEAELIKLGKEGIKNADGTRRGPLALDREYLLAIKKYFEKEGRRPTDVELESLAQTWSEHCKHTIFAAKIDDNEDGLYKGYIKKATREIRRKKGKRDFCVSVFSDNSGGIIFDENWIITDKAETHNTPSALEPFGGAITGIVGVNRDTIGFGKGAKPIINKYGFCVGRPDDSEPLYRDKNLKIKTLSPRRILDGVVAGVNAGGNQSGIPTPQGFVYFDDSYKGKPLVFVGTVGLIPREVNGKPSWEKKAKKGDKIVVIGGRAGQDGIHGATFSSEALDAGSPMGAVQIGDPITQKKFSDAIVKEARDLDLYHSITDNGAGGLSCSVAEMARECGGCEVDLDQVPLKYPNLEPWKIWVSESQERMTLAVPSKKLDKFISLMERRGVEAVVIGEFTDSGRCLVKYHTETVMDIDLNFLHNGLPRKELKTGYTKKKYPEADFKQPKDLNKTLREMLSRPNIASYEFISRQYDHIVQGGAVLGPIQGKGRVNASASVVKPLIESDKAIVCSSGLNPRYSQIDTYHMAACAIDTAVRNAIAVGGDINHLALMDNFCWCGSDEAERLGELKAAAEACYDCAVYYGAPYISGKDSMFNDFKGFDKKGKAVKISVLPTLLISSISVMNDVTKAVSLDPKFAGDLIYVLGETKDELGGSEYFDYQSFIGNSVPQVEKKQALELYTKFVQAVDRRLIASALSPGIGGLGITIAKKAIAGGLGMEIDLARVPCVDIAREDYLLFSETQSRFIVTVDPKRKEEFEKMFRGVVCAEIGRVVDGEKFVIRGLSGNEIINTEISRLEDCYKNTFRNY